MPKQKRAHKDEEADQAAQQEPLLTALPIPEALITHLKDSCSTGILPATGPNPETYLSVIYGTDLPIDFGTQIDERDKRVSRAPKVTFSAPDASSHYTLLMVDPDAPGPKEPSQRSVLHWAVTDISGSKGDADGGQLAVSYRFPSPDWGNHRFVFILMRQGKKSPLPSLSAIQLPTARVGFNVSQCMSEQDLTLVGLNFFCQHAPEFSKRKR